MLREAFSHMVPADQEWSSMAIFEGVLRGKFKPLYDIKGRPQSLARMPEPDSGESGDEMDTAVEPDTADVEPGR